MRSSLKYNLEQKGTYKQYKALSASVKKDWLENFTSMKLGDAKEKRTENERMLTMTKQKNEDWDYYCKHQLVTMYG